MYFVDLLLRTQFSKPQINAHSAQSVGCDRQILHKNVGHSRLKINRMKQILLLLAMVALFSCVQAQETSINRSEKIKSVRETFYYNCKKKSGNYIPGLKGSENEYVYDENGRIVKAIEYLSLGQPFRYSQYEYDNHGQMTKNLLLDERGDTLINCRYTYTYDSLNRPTTELCECDGEIMITEHIYTHYADSIVCETFENKELKFRTVCDTMGRKLKSYSHHDGMKFSMVQYSVYYPDDRLPNIENTEDCNDVYLYAMLSTAFNHHLHEILPFGQNDDGCGTEECHGHPEESCDEESPLDATIGI